MTDKAINYLWYLLFTYLSKSFLVIYTFLLTDTIAKKIVTMESNQSYWKDLIYYSNEDNKNSNQASKSWK